MLVMWGDFLPIVKKKIEEKKKSEEEEEGKIVQNDLKSKFFFSKGHFSKNLFVID